MNIEDVVSIVDTYTYNKGTGEVVSAIRRVYADSGEVLQESQLDINNCPRIVMAIRSWPWEKLND